MAKASDVLDVEDGEELDVQPVAEHAGGAGDHESIVDGAYAEGEADALFEEIAAQEGEPTADDLRKIAGEDAEGLTDEQLLAEYAKAVAGQSADGEEAVDADTKINELPFPVYDANGNKITSDKLTLGDLLSGKVQIGYNAMGKEQRKTLTDLLRVAANGHYNENKMNTLMSERAQIAAKLSEMRKEHEAWGSDRKIWDQVLNAYANGNAEPLKKLIQAYTSELGKMPANAPVDNTAQERELEAAGQRFILDTIVPAATKMASDYGANATEITNAILHAIQQEPVEFLTREKIADIINYEIPSLLEQNGYARGAAAAPTTPAADPMAAKVAALEKQLQELTAGKANAATAAIRQRSRTAPAAGGGSTPSAGDSMPNLKSREDMKKWMRGDL